MRKKILLTILIIIALISSACSAPTTKTVYPVKQTDFMLNTISTITIYGGENIADPNQLIADAFQLCHEYENMLSRTIESSDISKINSSNGEPIIVSDKTANLISEAISYGNLSDGALDVAIEPISCLWDFQSEEHIVPSKQIIAENLAHVDYTKIILDGNTVTLADKNMGIDLGAIAKGYIADRIKDFLVEKGVTNGIVDLGGNILTIGGRSDEKSFTIGIQKPFDQQNTVIASISVINRSVVTSGIYERYFDVDGKIYHHILNPKTGYPVENELASVTIISDTSIEGDALSTSCFVLGSEKGMELINSLENVDAVFITKDNKFVFSDGIGTDVEFEEIK